MKHTFSITVKGIVQGVYYRKYCKDTALKLGITGEVRNLPDGDVHIIATGTEPQLNEFVEWCNRGPDTSVVASVKIEEISLKEFGSFRILR
jgi:acylphosphatase